jgi:hypothetical protein
MDTDKTLVRETDKEVAKFEGEWSERGNETHKKSNWPRMNTDQYG